jgi:catechol 2,3-dioxygenase-like lactoylglutathione lyase family enzyme
MPSPGRFLEVSLPTPDIGASLEFYRTLGFTEVTVNDIRPHQYIAVTDGRLVIGLHGGGVEAPALTFVQRDLARHVRDLVDAGIEPEFARIADDEFHEAGLRSPGGHLLAMVEAPTYSPGALADAPPPLVGQVADVLLRTADVPAELCYFLAAGFAPLGDDRLNSGALTLALQAGWPVAGPILRLAGALDRAQRAALGERGLAVARRPQGEVIVAPEGTWLVAGA